MTSAKLSTAERVRVLLVLGRVSNLPTVWSNCLAAWSIAGGGKPTRFVSLCAGATLLYTGGMFLNDACDIEFDRKHRPERPIVSGQIRAQTVWLSAGALLLLGWLALMPLGRLALIAGSTLLAAIVIYDAVHKHTGLAPLLMACCRFLLYVMAGSAARRGVGPLLIIDALALAAYIIGLSYLARKESTGGCTSRWSAPLLFAPIAAAFTKSRLDQATLWLTALAQCAWVLWCLRRSALPAMRFLSHGVAGLLAGIVLVDWLAAAGSVQGLSGAFIGLFIVALLSQHFAPAT